MIPLLDYIKANSNDLQTEEELLQDYFIDYTEEEKKEYNYDKNQLGTELLDKYFQKNWQQLLTKIPIAAI
jgi:hypothetical protein